MTKDTDTAISRAGIDPMGNSSSLWPNNSPFALFLSHDVDQVYDREMFRLLGDVNHLRRIWMKGEQGRPLPCIKRIARSLLRPRPPGHDIDTILSIEAEFGYRSTFFLLEDRTFNRLGGRYRYEDPDIKRIARAILDGGCEIAVHGSYHHDNDAERFRAQIESFKAAFGVSSVGVRNHGLQHDGMITWRAQREAGFQYDASFGFNSHIGMRDNKATPFLPFDNGNAQMRSFVVLPMTIMDSALFWGMRTPVTDAFSICQRVATDVIRAGGLLCLNWHNNYFNDQEYKPWQDVYEQLLAWLKTQNPWNATGAELSNWWISHKMSCIH